MAEYNYPRWNAANPDQSIFDAVISTNIAVNALLDVATKILEENKKANQTVGFASTLMTEYLNRADADGNNRIYGKDFLMADADLPPLLKYTQEDIIASGKAPTDKWTEAQYYLSLQNL